MRSTLALALFALATAVVPTAVPAAAHAKPRAPSTPLGRIDFPVTGGEAARRHFVRGVLALHSFWYDEARDEFRAATKGAARLRDGLLGRGAHLLPPGLEPGGRRRREEGARRGAGASGGDAARAGLSRRGARARRRRRLRRARRALQGGDARGARALARRRRGDDAVRGGAARHGRSQVDRVPRGRREAAALCLDVFARNPNHPGAAHYIIHAFDDPDHAMLALPAARRYAQIAPEALHARHMPSHIFVQLGMWTEAEASNESAWAASQAWIARKMHDASYGDFHSLVDGCSRFYLELGQRQEGRRGARPRAQGARRGAKRGTRGCARSTRSW